MISPGDEMTTGCQVKAAMRLEFTRPILREIIQFTISFSDNSVVSVGANRVLSVKKHKKNCSN